MDTINSYKIQIQDFVYKIWNMLFLFFMTLLPITKTNKYGSAQYRVGQGGVTGTQRRFGSIKHGGKGPKAPSMMGGGG